MESILSAIGGLFAGPLAWIVKPVLDFLWNKISAIIHAAWSQHEANLAKQEQADKDRAQLEQAKTPEEKKNAATAINHDTFGGS